MLLPIRSISLFFLSIDAINAFSVSHYRAKSINLADAKSYFVSTALHSSSVSESDDSNAAAPPMDMEEAKKIVPAALLMSEEELWGQQLNSQEVQEVRRELVLKYTSLGSSPEVAEQEVDEFLSDKERCQQYLEMRRYAQAQADDLADFSSVGQLGLAFVIGMIGTVGPKLYDVYQHAN